MVQQSMTQWLANFASGYIGHVPIFANGQQIGYADNPQQLCKGIITLSVNNPPPPETWIVPAPYGGILALSDIPVSQWCVNNGIVPSWATKNATGAVQYTAPSGSVITATPQTDGSFAVPAMHELFGLDQKQMLTIGAVGLGALLLLAIIRR